MSAVSSNRIFQARYILCGYQLWENPRTLDLEVKAHAEVVEESFEVACVTDAGVCPQVIGAAEILFGASRADSVAKLPTKPLKYWRFAVM